MCPSRMVATLLPSDCWPLALDVRDNPSITLDSRVRVRLTRWRARFVFRPIVTFEQDPLCGALEVVVLPVSDRPHE